MKYLLFIFLTPLFFFTTILSSFGQDSDYEVLSTQTKGGFTFSLEIHEDPTLGHPNWLKTVLIVPEGQEIELSEINFSAEVYLGEATDGNSTKYMDGLFEKRKKLTAETYTGGEEISKAIGIEIGFGNEKPLKITGLLSYNLMLKGQKEALFEIVDLPFSFVWNSPNALQYILLQDEMSSLLRNGPNGHLEEKQLDLFLDHKEMIKNLDAPDLLLARKMRSRNGKYYDWITNIISESFGDHPVIIEDYLDRLEKEVSFDALLELNEFPNIWDIALLEPLIQVYSQENPGIMYRVMDILYLHQKEWTSINRNQLSEITKKVYASIYESEPEDIIASDQIAHWCSMAVLLGKTGDKQHIPILKPFLEVQEVALKSGFPGVSGETRPLRVCDNALEAILVISGQGIDELYRSKDLSAEELRDKRDALIETLKKEN